MKQKLDKFKNKLKSNNKIIIFLFSLTIIGIISGSIFSIIISNNDKMLVKEQLSSFFDTVKHNNLDSLLLLKNSVADNYFSVLLIWTLGISIIGIPIIILIFFTKIFVIGFTVSSIISNYNIKGFLITLAYIFPHQIINILLYFILLIYSLAFSVKLIHSLVKRRNLDFKPIINKYLMILLLCLVVFLLTSIYESYIMPKLLYNFV